MNTQELKDKLKEFQVEEKELLKKHKNISLPTEEEIKKYILDNHVELDRLKFLQKEIKEIEWQLMSPKEQQELLDYYEKVREKYADD